MITWQKRSCRNEVIWEGKAASQQLYKAHQGRDCLSLLLFRCSGLSDSLQLHGLQHSRLPCPSLSPGVCSNSCPLSQWCHPTISPSVSRFSSLPQYFPDHSLYQWVGSSPQVAQQSIGASGSVLPMNNQGWFLLRLTDLIFQSKGLSRVFSSTTVQSQQLFGAQPSLGFPSGSYGKESGCNVGYLGSIFGLGRSPGEGKSYPLLLLIILIPKSSILAWIIPWTKEPGRLQTVELQRVGHHWATEQQPNKRHKQALHINIRKDTEFY